MGRDDTLTKAEEQALARAKQNVSRPRSSSSGSTRKKPAASTGKRKRRRGPGRSATLDAARGLLLVGAACLLTIPDGWLPAVLRSPGGDGFGLADVVPAAFAVLAGVALDHQLAARTKQRGRWWVGRLLRRVAVLVAVGLALAWLAHRDLSTLPWTSAYARIGLGGLAAWFVARDLARRAQVVIVATWVTVTGLLAWRGRVPFDGLDEHLLGLHTVPGHDPDGTLGILSTTVLIVVGTWLGGWLRARPAGPATVTAFTLTAAYTTLAGIGWAQLTPVSAARWTGPTLLLGIGAAVLLLAIAHLLHEVIPSGTRLRWLPAIGATALPLGAAGLVAAHLLGVGDDTGPWAHVLGGWVEPLVGGTWGALLVALVTVVTLGTSAERLVARGRALRA